MRRELGGWTKREGVFLEWGDKGLCFLFDSEKHSMVHDDDDGRRPTNQPTREKERFKNTKNKIKNC